MKGLLRWSRTWEIFLFLFLLRFGKGRLCVCVPPSVNGWKCGLVNGGCRENMLDLRKDLDRVIYGVIGLVRALSS